MSRVEDAHIHWAGQTRATAPQQHIESRGAAQDDKRWKQESIALLQVCLKAHLVSRWCRLC